MHDAELFLSDLDAIAFCQGPGSFTGIRLAASLVQGLAYGADLPVIPVSTLAAMALGAYRKFGVSRVLPALDAKMGQIYWAAYHLVDEKTVEAIRVDSLADPEQMVMPSTGEWIGVGDGWQSYGLKAACNHRLIAVHQEFYPQARSILAFAADQCKKEKEYQRVMYYRYIYAMTLYHKTMLTILDTIQSDLLQTLSDHLCAKYSPA